MKVPIDQFAVIDLEAPVLPAYEAFVGGSTFSDSSEGCPKFDRSLM